MTQIKQLLATNAWISELPEAVVDELAARAQLRRLADGELLYARGDEPTGLYGVISGRVRISATSLEGKEVTVTWFEPGDWLGEISIFDGLPRISDAFAVGETEVLVLARAVIQDLLARQPELYAPFVKILCGKLRMALHYMADMMFLPLSGRLAKRLLDLARDYGQPHEQGILITLHLPQDELGRMLGTSRQSVSKELKALEAKGLVSLAYGKVVVSDVDGMKALVEGGSGPEI